MCANETVLEQRVEILEYQVRLLQTIEEIQNKKQTKTEKSQDQIMEKLEYIIDNFSRQFQTIHRNQILSEEKLTDKINSVEGRLTNKINRVEEKLTTTEEKLTDKINSVEGRLTKVEVKLTSIESSQQEILKAVQSLRK